MKGKPVAKFGYWGKQITPDKYVVASLTDKEKKKICKWLAAAKAGRPMKGCATCRICDARLGCCDMTLNTKNREFIFPQAYEHYVEKHNVIPDDMNALFSIFVEVKAMSLLACRASKIQPESTIQPEVETVPKKPVLRKKPAESLVAIDGSMQFAVSSDVVGAIGNPTVKLWMDEEGSLHVYVGGTRLKAPVHFFVPVVY